MKRMSEYICQQCGYKSPSFLGKCPECGEWNSLVETIAESSAEGALGKSQGRAEARIKVEESLVKLSQVKSQALVRITTGFAEFDRVLGGGIVPGSIVLVSGDPGIGKSTLLLECAMKVAASRSVLYVSGEESAQQIKIRAERITSGKRASENLFILPATSIEAVLEAVRKITPGLIIVDSIQTLTLAELTGSAGSVGQVRECSQILQRLAKDTQIPVFIVGHVTKEGNVAGPKVLEHLVDAVLNLEGDGMHMFRLLRSIKNRFGSTFEVGVFEMADVGMVEVSNPSKIFLSERIAKRPGSVVTSTVAGGRPILAEVQALVNTTIFPVPTRRVSGLDFARMQVVIAALSKVSKLPLGNMDVYLNVAGGLRVVEPAADLAAALAVASAFSNKALGSRACAFGEVGLLGELRGVNNTKSRIAEAKRLGFSDFIYPERFKTLEEAIEFALR